MQFRHINKSLYRQRYKTLGYALVAALIVLALSLSSLFVALWGQPNSGDNFYLNLTAVGLAAFLLVGLLNLYNSNPYLAELVYVWDLKQALNKINRRLRKLRIAAKQGDAKALLILQYYYQGCEQLWTLDDNTLMMPELKLWQAELEKWKQQFNVSVEVADYCRDLLLSYK